MKKVVLPLDIHKYADVRSGDVIIIGNESNSGATAFMLSTAVANMHDFDVIFFDTLVEADDFGRRMRMFRDPDMCEISDRIKLCHREDDFASVVRTSHSDINMIDYIQSFYGSDYVFHEIERLASGIGSGIAFVSVHKSPKYEYAYGFKRCLDISDMYITLGFDSDYKCICRILKSRNDALSGRSVSYNIVDGCRFLTDDKWI